MNDTIKVSIICNAYNHEKYIRDAIEGFLMQKTNFAFEILIHDDASTDNTASIIKEYELNYPNLIKPIYQKNNQHSQKIPITDTFQLPRARGKYIALCEGDDYWIDALKLQKQYDLMEAHPEIDMCAHKGKMLDTQGNLIKYFEPCDRDTILSPEQTILGGGGYIITNSLFYRASLLTPEMQFKKYYSIDYSLQILGSLRGGIMYLNDCMSAYRFMSSTDAWTTKVMTNLTKREEAFQKKQKMLEILNKETNYRFNNAIQETLLNNKFLYYLSSDMYKEILSKELRIHYSKLPLSQRIKIRIKYHLPFISKIILKLQSFFN